MVNWPKPDMEVVAREMATSLSKLPVPRGTPAPPDHYLAHKVGAAIREYLRSREPSGVGEKDGYIDVTAEPGMDDMMGRAAIEAFTTLNLSKRP